RGAGHAALPRAGVPLRAPRGRGALGDVLLAHRGLREPEAARLSLTRRDFLAAAAAGVGKAAASFGAAAMGATAPCGGIPDGFRTGWVERRESFPEGVASGDPDAESVILWTRSPGAESLTVEVAEDPAFVRVVAAAPARALADADHTCRVLVHGLRPA